MNACKAASPEIDKQATDETAKAADSKDLTGGALYQRGRTVEERLLEVTCVFVAFTIFRNAAANGNTKNARNGTHFPVKPDFLKWWHEVLLGPPLHTRRGPG